MIAEKDAGGHIPTKSNESSPHAVQLIHSASLEGCLADCRSSCHTHLWPAWIHSSPRSTFSGAECYGNNKAHAKGKACNVQVLIESQLFGLGLGLRLSYYGWQWIIFFSSIPRWCFSYQPKCEALVAFSWSFDRIDRKAEIYIQIDNVQPCNKRLGLLIRTAPHWQTVASSA